MSFRVVWAAFRTGPRPLREGYSIIVPNKICGVPQLRRGTPQNRKEGDVLHEKTAHQLFAGVQHDAEPCANRHRCACGTQQLKPDNNIDNH